MTDRHVTFAVTLTMHTALSVIHKFNKVISYPFFSAIFQFYISEFVIVDTPERFFFVIDKKNVQVRRRLSYQIIKNGVYIAISITILNCKPIAVDLLLSKIQL